MDCREIVPISRNDKRIAGVQSYGRSAGEFAFANARHEAKASRNDEMVKFAGVLDHRLLWASPRNDERQCTIMK